MVKYCIHKKENYAHFFVCDMCNTRTYPFLHEKYFIDTFNTMLQIVEIKNPNMQDIFDTQINLQVYGDKK